VVGLSCIRVRYLHRPSSQGTRKRDECTENSAPPIRFFLYIPSASQLALPTSLLPRQLMAGHAGQQASAAELVIPHLHPGEPQEIVLSDHRFRGSVLAEVLGKHK
jgi:hypothetical protein